MAADFFHSLEKEIIKKRDFSLIKSTLSGNHKSFGMLMALYKLRIVSFGRSFFKDERDIEDFVQDVFIKAFSSIKDFRQESAFSTWLVRIAYTTAINSKKRKKIYESISEDDEIPSQIRTPEQEQIFQFTKESVKEAVGQLPEKYAVCVDMYFFYGMSHEEISVITGFPVNTIKSNIFRAKKILATKLKNLNG